MIEATLIMTTGVIISLSIGLFLRKVINRSIKPRENSKVHKKLVTRTKLRRQYLKESK